MKKYNLKNHDNSEFIALSKKLRFELEVHLKDLRISGKFQNYLETDFKLEFLTKECDIMISRANSIGKEDHIKALAVCKGIKIWYGMYYKDRASVIQQFNLLYETHLNNQNTFLIGNLHLEFVRIFIYEFAYILSDAKWTKICQLGYD